MANLKRNNEMIKHNNYLLVRVPEDSYGYWLPETNFPQVFFYLHGWTFGDEEFQLSDKVILPDEHYSEKLGEWRKYYQIIGLAKDLTEEQWKGITPKMPDPMIDLWENFEDKQMWALTAVESGMTLLRKHSLEPNQTLILKEVEK